MSTLKTLRTQCNDRGMSCRDSQTGKYLSITKLRALLGQRGGAKPKPLALNIQIPHFITHVEYTNHQVGNPFTRVNAAIVQTHLSIGNFDTTEVPSAGIGIGVHGINAVNVYHKYGQLPEPVLLQLVANIQSKFPPIIAAVHHDDLMPVQLPLAGNVYNNE